MAREQANKPCAMSRIYNFNSGPATLPQEVLQQASEELPDWRGSGLSVMEMSHRGEAFSGIIEEAEADLRQLLDIPSNYKVLFLQGGASLQFAMLPINLLPTGGVADYVNSGVWSKKAIAAAQHYGRINIAASSEEKGFTCVPPPDEWRQTSGAAYLHYTSNETINGVEFNWIPQSDDTPLVSDMSSNILSRPLDVSRFALIYAGAQKNLGTSGLTVVIIREDIAGRASPLPYAMLDYGKHIEAASLLNTPPTYSIYISGLVFKWLQKAGGISAIQELNIKKSQLLYDCIDHSDGFYVNSVDRQDRSRMNVPFILHNQKLSNDFLKGAAACGLSGLIGHRSQGEGAMRASIYNALPLAGAQALANYMYEFADRHG